MDDSYVDYLTPGIVVMTAAFAGGWAGMGVIEDLNRGVVDRFLVSPVARPALISGRLVQLAIVSLVQSLIVRLLGLAVGARFPGGATGLTAQPDWSLVLSRAAWPPSASPAPGWPPAPSAPTSARSEPTPTCARGSSGQLGAAPPGVGGEAPRVR